MPAKDLRQLPASPLPPVPLLRRPLLAGGHGSARVPAPSALLSIAFCRPLLLLFAALRFVGLLAPRGGRVLPSARTLAADLQQLLFVAAAFAPPLPPWLAAKAEALQPPPRAPLTAVHSAPT